MIDYTEFESTNDKELTKIEREYVDKLYKRERGQQDILSKKYHSVIFGKYTFVTGDDPFGLQTDWPEKEKHPVRDNVKMSNM